MSKLNSIFLLFNGGKNSGNHAPGQGRGIGKPGSGRGGFSHNTTFSDKDDVEYTFSDGTKVKGELFYSFIDDFWSIRYQRPGDKITYSVRLDSSDKWDKVKKIKSASKKEEEKILEELKEQGITHKSPKERQTKRQKEIIRSLDKMGVLSSDMNKWLSNYGDENVLGEIENELSKAKELGLKLNDIALEKKTTGTKVLGSAGISKDGYNIKFTGQVLDGNPVKIKKMTNDSKKFHTSDTVKGLVRHEIGHIISYYIANGGLSPHGADRHGLEDIDANAGTYCQALIKKAIGKENMSPRQVSQYIENASTKDISRYGKTDAYEFVAEAYSNPDYSEVTRKLTNELTQDLKNLKQGKPVIFNKRKDENNSDEIEICSGYGPEEITISISNGHLEKLNRLEIQLNGGKNSGNHNPGQGRGIGKPGGGSYLSSQAKNLTWNEYKSQMRDEKFRKTAVDAGLKSYDDLWQFWAETKNKDFSNADIYKLDEKTTKNIIENTIPKNAWLGWFRNANSDYKPIIVNKILENKELRNAGLNLAYQNYKNLNDNPLSFNDFLNTEMKMYRGHRGQKTVESDWFDSYTPKREFAEQFGNEIKTISIKPKDTLGSYTTNAESEYLILTKLKQENSIQFNGGPGSGNPNPGQGRGKGKPAGGGSSKQERMKQVLKKLFDVQEELDNNPDKTKIKELKSLEEKYTKEAKQLEKEIELEETSKLEEKFEVKKDKKSFSEIQSTFEKLKKQANWTKEEVGIAGSYFGGSNYQDIQEYMRGGEDFTLSNGHKASEAAEVLKRKIESSSLPENVTLYRAITIRNDRIQRVENNQFSSPVFQSTSLNEMNAIEVAMGYMADESFAEFNEVALLKINAKKGSKGIASYTPGEYEVVLPPDSVFKIKGKKNMISHIEYEVDYE
ncbi:MAG: hypothetical protein IJ122_06035 [Methanobrevibacter sp.]|nr:hypothetical protein [Methanobrevibacter sp.]